MLAAVFVSIGDANVWCLEFISMSTNPDISAVMFINITNSYYNYSRF